MKRTLAVALTMGMVSLAAADTNTAPIDAPELPLETPWSRPQATYVLTEPGLPMYRDADQVHAAPGFSNVIYLNNCKPNGCQVRPGNDSSINNTSIIPQQNSVVQPYAFSDANWNLVVECVKQTYAAFDVEIVTERPTSGNYHMAIVAGRPQDVQMQSGVGGVSPFSCGYIPNAISFSFANIYGGSVDDICWTVAQETAHSWGLDHKFDNRDPMTYLQSGPSRKVFQNESGRCGEFQARNCQCGGTTMNSFQAIMQTFGSSTPTPPTVTITAPADGQSGLTAGFPIRADIADDIGVSKAELRIDGQLISTLTAAPWVWNAPASLAQGNHTITITGYDIGNTPADASVTASIGSPCESSSDCGNATDVCVDGRCVAGSGVDGGLGTTCTNNSDCISGQCGGDGQGNNFCVEACDPERDACPSGFGCLATGAGGVCWPGANSDGGGCSSGGTPTPGLLFLGLAIVLAARRRRLA